MFLRILHSYRVSIFVVLLLAFGSISFSQTNFYPAVRANFGIRSAQLSGIDSSGMDDWAQGASGKGVILNSGTPDFTNFPNTAHIKDRAVGRGENSAFTSTSKTGDNPNAWTLGVANVSGKTDIVNAYAHARRDAQDSLWYFIAAERVTTNGATTVDFEFLKAGMTINGNGTITALGPDSGRTAGVVTTPVVNGGGTISKPGDLLVVTEYGGSSVTTFVYMWTKNPPSGVTFDQGSGIAPFGWALINPPAGSIIAEQNNSSVQSGPWGTFQGAGADSTTTLDPLAFVEVGLNMTKLGLDVDTMTCSNIGQAIVHSRTSPSFASGLADFAGPLAFSLNTCVTLTLQKNQDTDGLIGTTNDQSSKNWNLSIYRNSIAPSNLVASVASGSSLGTFDTLRRGNYIVTEADSSGWSHLGVLETSDVRGNVTYTSTSNSFSFVGGFGDSLTLKFVNARSASISGQKFKDANNNGAKDDGEPGLSGWTIQLQNTSGGIVASTTTDGSGNYSFAEVTPGVTYRVREVQQSGWVQTTTNPSDITPTAGQQITGINFGNARFATTTVTTSPNPSQRFQSVTITATVSPSEATGTVEFFNGTTSLGTANLSNGSASISTSSLPGGNNSITAVYSGDAQFNSSTSATHTHVVIRAASSTTLSSAPNPSVFGQSVSLTATLSPGNASGTVEFFEGTTSLGTATLNSGVATLNISSISVGNHSLKARYGGDSDFDTSTSAIHVHTVNKANTTTSVQSNVNPSVFGQSVTFTATVTASSPGAGTPTGSVEFFDGATSLGTATLSGGTGSVSTSSLSTGSHSITVVYNSDGNFNTSSSSSLIQTVNKANSSTSVQSSVNPSVFGQSVTFTATISASSPGAGTPSGSVEFFDGATSLGTVTLSSGSASVSTSSLSTGSHSITVVFNGDGNFNTSTSSALNQTVSKANTATSLVSNQNPSVFGQSVTFTATVTATSPGAGTPTGSVEFFDGVTSLGTSTLSGGSASLSTSTLSTSSHSITAVYSSDVNFNASTSPALTQTVNRASSTSSVSSNLNPSVYGQSVTFTATVSPSTATGSMEFFVDNVSIGTGSITAGSASLSTSLLTAGSHAVRAQYGGDVNYEPSVSSNITQTVNQAPTTTSISAPTITYNANGIVTVTVSSGVGTPTGNVSLSVDGGSAMTQSLVNGSTTFTLTSPSAGDHSLSTTFSAQGNYDASSASGTLHVNRAPTTVSINAPTITYNANGSVTVTMTSASGTVLGDVSLSVDGGAATTQTLSNGSTTFTLASPSAGDHSLSVTFAAQGNFDAGAGTGTLHVNQAATSTSISASTITYNANGTVTVSVSSTAGTVTGNVSLSVDGGAATTQALTNGSSVFTITSPNAGDHSLSASYSAQGNFDASSASGNLHVNPAPTSISIDAPTITFGQNGTVTLTVSSAAGIPSGTISLSVDGGAAQTEQLLKGTATFTVNNPTGGDHSLSATYSAQGNFDASSASGTLHVNKASSSSSVVSSLNPSIFGQSVMFTATVTPINTTGTVEFFDGVTSLGTAILLSGTASVSTSTLSAADHAITAVYSGDQNFNGSTSAVLTQSVVNPLPFTTNINPSLQTIGNPSFTLTVFGGNFIPSSVVRFNGSDRATTYISATEVQATILNSDVTAIGEYLITVFNPTPGGGLSNAQTLTVIGASISGMKFNDLDGDGTKDQNEPGISNWSIAINGPATQTIQTNVNGQFTFYLELPGTYTVTEVNQSGWQQTTTSPAPIAIQLGQIITGVNFGNFKAPKISGFKFEDANGNGVFDNGETGLEGWTINAVNGVQSKSTTTASDGSYSFIFSTTETGTWTLSEVMQSGWSQSSPPNGTHTVLAVSAVDTTNVNFGNYRPASISGQKFEDLTGDSLTTDDATLSGWVIKLFKNNEFVNRAVTDVNGEFMFDGLLPGSYIVQESLQVGWIQTVPQPENAVAPVADSNAAPQAYFITVASGENVIGKEFANFKLGSISGEVFHDYDGDGTQDGNEGNLPGWTITLTKNSSHVGSTVSQQDGSYGFGELTAGEYSVTQVMQDDWYQTTPATVSFTLTIQSGSILTEKNFGNFQFGSIRGNVFWDRDSSTTFDTVCEVVIDGVPVILESATTQPETTVTDVNGLYSFDPVGAGTYSVKVLSSGLWRQTKPSGGNPYTIPMHSGLDTSNLQFGSFYQPDTVKFRTFTVLEYNKAPIARQRSGFIRKPNGGNAKDSVFAKLAFTDDTRPTYFGYLTVGIPRPDSALYYGWYSHTFSRTGLYNRAAVRHWLFNTDALKNVRNKQKQIVRKKPTDYFPVKYVGEKWAEPELGNIITYGTVQHVALKTNIAASDIGVTPAGFGELVYSCGSFAGDSIVEGKTLRQISRMMDSMLTMGRLVRGEGDTVYRYPKWYFNIMDSVMSTVNGAFTTSRVETTSTNPLKFKGKTSLFRVKYLKRDTSQIGVVAMFEQSFRNLNEPLSFSLEQNYPNPFNPITVISYSLSVNSSVTLKVYDILGREVATLLNSEEMESGIHEIEFDASNFTSGVYYYKLEAEQHHENGISQKFTSIKKMLLMR
ncbi:MAG: Ig-like domain repeat protein [Ignavibacteriae bacterium]|nr:Ig-like domain repeat protein [Ignavibacteriota bacterium]